MQQKALRAAALRFARRCAACAGARPLAGSLAATQPAAASPPWVASQLASPEVLWAAARDPAPQRGHPCRLLPVASLPSHKGSARLLAGARAVAFSGSLFAPLPCCRPASLGSPGRARRARRLWPARHPPASLARALVRAFGPPRPLAAAVCAWPALVSLRAPCSVALALLGLGLAQRVSPPGPPAFAPFGASGPGGSCPGAFAPLRGACPGLRPRGFFCSRPPAAAALTGAACQPAFFYYSGSVKASLRRTVSPWLQLGRDSAALTRPLRFQRRRA